LLDRTAEPHPRAWERQSWWTDVPTVHLVRRVASSEKPAVDHGHQQGAPSLIEPLHHDWTPSNRDSHSESVEVYTNCDEAELFLNNRSLGRQKLHTDASPLTWDVPYESGSLKAVAYRQGAPAAEDELRTAGKAARIVLSSDRSTISSDRNDVVTVVAMLVDASGVPVPDSDPAASAEVEFTVSGPVLIIATDNGSTNNRESFLLPHHHLYNGRAIAILRATKSAGSIRVHASSAGIANGDLQLSAIPAQSDGFVRTF
jgi:beta-galactosidase